MSKIQGKMEIRTRGHHCYLAYATMADTHHMLPGVCDVVDAIDTN
jgi:hypothetical protein